MRVSETEQQWLGDVERAVTSFCITGGSGGHFARVMAALNPSLSSALIFSLLILFTCHSSYFRFLYSIVFPVFVFNHISGFCIQSYFRFLYSIIFPVFVFNRISGFCIQSYFRFLYSIVFPVFVFNRISGFCIQSYFKQTCLKQVLACFLLNVRKQQLNQDQQLV